MKTKFQSFIFVIVLSMFVAACGSSTPAAMPTGEWTGSVSAGNGIGYPVEITFDECARGEVCAKVNYFSLDCESNLTFIKTKGGLPVFEETVTYGNYCKSGRTVQMTYMDVNTPLTLQWFEKNGQAGPVASLNSGRAVAPTLAPISIPGLGHEVFSFQNLGLFINWGGELIDGSLWLPDSHSGNLIRIDVTTNQIVATIKVGDPENPRTDGYDPNAVAVSGDQVWVTMRAQKSVGRIDISTNQLVETIAIEAIPYDLILDGNTLWISAFDNDEVIRIDLDTKKVTTIHAISKPLGIAVSGDSVWVVEHRNGELVRIDSQTNNVLARIDLSLPAPAPGAQPEEVIIAEGSVWVANNGGRTVSRVDAVTNEILATIRFEGLLKPFRLASGGGFIWVSLVEEVGSNAGDWIAQINPATNEVVKETPFDYAGFLIYDNDTLWVGDSYGNIDKRAGDRVFRIELMP